MGTERSIEFEGPCLCGRGTFRIDDCQVDHSWPTARPQWYESKISCPDCEKKFTIEKRGGRFFLIERAALQNREDRQRAVANRVDEILADDEVVATLVQFESLLGAQRSVAAVYRLLRDADLESCAEGTFRKHWRGPREWVRQWARPRTLPQIYAAVGASRSRLDRMLSELATLEVHANEPIEPYGEPVYAFSAR